MPQPRAGPSCSQAEFSDDLVVSTSQKTAFERKLSAIIQECNPEEAQKKLEQCGVTDLELKNLTGVVVRFCLFKNAATPGIPFRRKELVDQLAKGQQSNYFIRIATAELASVYGLELREVYRVLSVEKTSQETVFRVRSMLPEPLLPLILDSKEAGMRGFIMAVVALVTTNGGKMEKEEFLNNLEQLGFTVGTPHPEFGQWEKKLLDVVLQRRYLITYKDANSGNEEFYALGESGLDEFSQQDIHAFLGRLFGHGGG